MSMRVYGGGSGKVYASPSSDVEIGELYVHRGSGSKVFLKVIEFEYVSSVDEQFLAETSRQGLDASPLRLTFSGSPTTLVCRLKPLVEVSGAGLRPFKGVIRPGAELSRVQKSDLSFLESTHGLFFGNIRSGHSVIDVGVRLEPYKTTAEHILIAATTGRGKSNFLKTLLWSLMDTPSVGVVVVDPHREYYSAMRDHPKAHERILAFSPSPTRGEVALAVSTQLIHPSHVQGAINLSEAQEREASLLAKARPSSADGAHTYGNNWIEALLTGEALGEVENTPQTFTARVTLARKLSRLLSADESGHYGVFRVPSFVRGGEISGEEFLNQVTEALDSSKIVILDTSSISGDAEILLGNMVCQELLERNMRRKQSGEEYKPVAVVLEEAPRVLSRDSTPNAYMRVAREGRKFGVGLIAVTQLISVIPEDILANMNTKVYFGMASGGERRAAVDNALNDMDDEEEELVRLNVGEAILSSVGVGFAVPIKTVPIDSLKRQTQQFSPPLARPGEKLFAD